MTLVVAKVCGERIGIECDSKITTLDEPWLSENPYIYGALKTVIVSPELTVSFAGLTETANENFPNTLFSKIWEIKVSGTLSAQSVLDECLELQKKVYEQTGKDFDFIVCDLQDTPMLYKVENRRIYNGNHTYWIGNIEGYRIFDRNFQPLVEKNKQDENTVMPALVDAFTTVMENTITDDVDGFQMGVHNKDGYFEYAVRAEIHIAKPMTIKPKETKALAIGDAADGSFSITYFVSEEKERPSVGVFLPQGMMGVFYYPENNENRIIYKDVTDLGFVEAVMRDYSVLLGGLVMDMETGRLTYTGRKPLNLCQEVELRGITSDGTPLEDALKIRLFKNGEPLEPVEV